MMATTISLRALSNVTGGAPLGATPTAGASRPNLNLGNRTLGELQRNHVDWLNSGYFDHHPGLQGDVEAHIKAKGG